MTAKTTYVIYCDAPGCEARESTLFPVVAQARTYLRRFGWRHHYGPLDGVDDVKASWDHCPDHAHLSPSHHRQQPPPPPAITLASTEDQDP